MTHIAILQALKAARRFQELDRIQAAVTAMLGRDLMPDSEHPGAEIETAVLARAADGHATASERRCCECGKRCVAVTTARVTVDLCLACRGLWFDAGELRQFTGVSGDELPGARYHTRASRHACPVCARAMRCCQYRVPHPVVLDYCPEGCGIYCEAGEFARVLDIEA